MSSELPSVFQNLHLPLRKVFEIKVSLKSSVLEVSTFIVIHKNMDVTRVEEENMTEDEDFME